MFLIITSQWFPVAGGVKELPVLRVKGSVRDFGPRVQKKEIGRIILDGSRDLFSVRELYGDLCKGNVPARVRGGIVDRTANLSATYVIFSIES